MTAPVAGVARPRCAGVRPLTARLEPWMRDLCADPDSLEELLAAHGSPVNVLQPAPLERNAAELRAAAVDRGVALEVYFARKANKSLALVDAARASGLGIDLASEPELLQCLARGVPGDALMMTAAVKPESLLERCLEASVTVAIDNHDELDRYRHLARRRSEQGLLALRLAPRLDGTPTRFGLSADEAVEAGAQLAGDPLLEVSGVHFHIDGYAAADRVRALGQALGVVDAVRAQGHPVGFVDIGGGVPMSYLDSVDQWEDFWDAHRDALRSEADPLTFDGHPLTRVYPAHQSPVRGSWLIALLDGDLGGERVADALRRRDLTLRMEPGRSLLDGVGITAARVEHRKQRADGTWLIAAAMNRTQCRSAADDFMVDPLLLRPTGAGEPTAPIEGYLVGAYCIERELLTWRRLRFDDGVAVGDVVVFPNTAGYLMHILESSSHQMPLARNLVLADDGGIVLDPIDSE